MWSLLLIKRNIRNKQIVFVRKSELVRTKCRIHAKWSKFWWFIKIQKITVIDLNIDWNESDAHSTILAFYRPLWPFLISSSFLHGNHLFAFVCRCVALETAVITLIINHYRFLPFFLLFNGAHNHNNNNPIGF